MLSVFCCSITISRGAAAQVREFLEKNYTEVAGNDAVKLCVKSLMELIEASGQTIEVMVMETGGLRMLSTAEVDAAVKEVEADAAAADAARRSQAGQAPAGQ
jgi:20S proteasome subunit alpha 4